MKLLILSNYFTPDFSAGSFRMQALVDALEAHRGEGLEVDLITTLPNRYASLKAEAAEFEDKGWLRIHRIALPNHKNGMADQARAYLTYAMAVRKLTKNKRWDLVFATSSRLMTAALGTHVAKRVNAPLYLDIRDLFTLNMRELWFQSPMRVFLPLFRRIEKRAFRSAALLNVVSEGFIPHIRSVAPQADMRCFTNGIDEMFRAEDFAQTQQREGLPLILYAGNMGDGQGLHLIVPQAAKALAGQARFRLIGDGGKRRALEEAIVAEGLTNVELLPPVSRGQLVAHYQEANILFLHLNELEAFQKVLPSKIFEYGATGRPMLAGVSGHAADFLARNLPDSEVFNPLDFNAMIKSARKLIAAQQNTDRTLFCETFARRKIMQQMAASILHVMKKSSS
jgi:glycosyltransferase involved in cell wall biosynthesis